MFTSGTSTGIRRLKRITFKKYFGDFFRNFSGYFLIFLLNSKVLGWIRRSGKASAWFPPIFTQIRPWEAQKILKKYRWKSFPTVGFGWNSEEIKLKPSRTFQSSPGTWILSGKPKNRLKRRTIKIPTDKDIQFMFRTFNVVFYIRKLNLNIF